jgi:polyhydroxyalkanoate synthase
MEAATRHDGSWWPEWQRWLAGHSSAKAKPPSMGAAAKGYRPLEDAPGQYVRQR